MPWTRAGLATLAWVAWFALGTGAALGDDRELVNLPAPMQEHMLANMRDHLRTLNEILAALAAGDAATAAKTAEQRIGMSSMGLHGAAHMAPYMPQPMQSMGSELHHAASRFAVAVENADIERTPEAQKNVFAALHDITRACQACHDAYRIR
jgi:cytochrome c556